MHTLLDILFCLFLTLNLTLNHLLCQSLIFETHTVKVFEFKNKDYFQLLTKTVNLDPHKNLAPGPEQVKDTRLGLLI